MKNNNWSHILLPLFVAALVLSDSAGDFSRFHYWSSVAFWFGLTFMQFIQIQSAFQSHYIKSTTRIALIALIVSCVSLAGVTIMRIFIPLENTLPLYAAATAIVLMMISGVLLFLDNTRQPKIQK